jgi:succinoglycan biosynthesis transport protein ExoP
VVSSTPAAEMGELRAAWSVLRRTTGAMRRRWPQALGIAALALTAVLLRLAIRPDRYEARGLLQVGLNMDVEEGEDFRFAGTATRAFYSQVELLSSERVLTQAMARADGAEVAPGRARDEALELFLDHLSVRPVRNTFLVEVSSWDPVPERSASRINALFDVYVRTSNEFLGERFRVQNALAQRREQDALGALRDAGARRAAFLERHGEVSFEARGTALAVRSGELEARAARVDVERSTIAAEASMVAANLGPGDDSASPEVMLGRLGFLLQAKELLAPVQEARSELARAEAELEAGHPLVRLQREVLRAQTDAVRTSLRALSEGRREELSSRAASLAGEHAEVARLLTELERERFRLTELQADHERLVREEAYYERELETTRASQWRTQGRSQVQLAAVILASAEVPREPASPFTPFALATAVLGALALGVLVVAVWDHVDDTLRSDEDVMDATGLPVLARLPALDVRQDERAVLRASADDSQAAAIGEAVRLLRTNTLHALGRPDRVVLLVTSAVPGEGKTLSSAALAAVMARTDGPALLVEGDLRRSRLGPLLGVDARDGLGQVLLGQRELAEAALSTELEGLSLLAAGPATSIRPSDLFTAGALARLVEAARAVFRVVVVDTPPVLGIADTSLLAPHVDGVLLVVRLGRARRRDVQATLTQLRAVHARVAGLVLTGHPERVAYLSYGPRTSPLEPGRAPT